MPRPQAGDGGTKAAHLHRGIPGARSSVLGAFAKWHPSCSWTVMLDVTLSILALIGGGVIMELFATSRPQVESPVEAGMIEDFQTGKAS